MAGGGGILDTLAEQRGRLHRAEARVAEAVLAAPEIVLRHNLTALSRRIDVSEATIVRFCKSVGCLGFPDFKLRLAEALARGTPYVSQSVGPGDGLGDVAAKVLAAGAAAIDRAAQTLDTAALEKAVDALASARRIICVGFGGSGPVALDACHKLFRLDVPIQSAADEPLARMAAAGLRAGDVLLTISNTGRTLAAIEIARLAREGSATVIALTAPRSALSAAADITIGVTPVEDSEVYTPMASRLAHLAVLDVLAVGLMLRRGPEFRQHLARVKAAANATRLPPEEGPKIHA